MLVLRSKRSVLVPLLCITFVLVQGTDRYVLPLATNGDGSFNSPFGSLQQAVDNSVDGDTILLFAGAYTGHDNHAVNLRNITNITFRSVDNDPRTAYILWPPSGTNESFLATTTTNSTLWVEGIGFRDKYTLDNNDASAAPTFRVFNSSTLTIKNCRFTNFTAQGSGASLYARQYNQSAIYVINSTFVGAAAHSGFWGENGYMNIQNCFFANFRGFLPATSALIVPRPVGTNTTLIVNGTSFVNNSLNLRLDEPNNVVLTNNNFLNCSSGNCISCGVLFNTTIANNKWCQNTPVSCPWIKSDNGIPTYAPDSCGVCGGDNSAKDCNGDCWGNAAGALCRGKRTWWVFPNGMGDGSSRNSPLGNISSAIHLANHTDTIILLAGNYTGSANLNISPLGKQLLITSENGNPDLDNVTITCDSVIGNAFWINSSESFDTVIQGINIEQCAKVGYYAPIFIAKNSGVTLRSINIRNSGNPDLSESGAIRVLEGYLNAEDITLENISSYGGGAVFILNDEGNTPSYIRIVNSRFIRCKSGIRGAALNIGYSTLDLFNNVFIENDSVGRAGSLYSNLNYLRASGNSFYNSGVTATSVPKAILCNRPDARSTASNNFFCGSFAKSNDTMCNAFGTPPLTFYDDCHVCNGNGTNRDCRGVCFGRDRSCL